MTITTRSHPDGIQIIGIKAIAGILRGQLRRMPPRPPRGKASFASAAGSSGGCRRAPAEAIAAVGMDEIASRMDDETREAV